MSVSIASGVSSVNPLDPTSAAAIIGESLLQNSSVAGPEFTLVNTNAMELELCAIPAKSLGPNGTVEAHFQFLITRGDGANTITFRWLLDDALLADYQVTSPNIGAEVIWKISNRGVENSQLGMRTNFAGVGQWGAQNAQTATKDTSQDQILSLVVAANTVNGTVRDKVQVTRRIIKLMPG